MLGKCTSWLFFTASSYTSSFYTSMVIILSLSWSQFSRLKLICKSGPMLWIFQWWEGITWTAALFHFLLFCHFVTDIFASFCFSPLSTISLLFILFPSLRLHAGSCPPGMKWMVRPSWYCWSPQTVIFSSLLCFYHLWVGYVVNLKAFCFQSFFF